jgi:hypothetical protein
MQQIVHVYFNVFFQFKCDSAWLRFLKIISYFKINYFKQTEDCLYKLSTVLESVELKYYSH